MNPSGPTFDEIVAALKGIPVSIRVLAEFDQPMESLSRGHLGHLVEATGDWLVRGFAVSLVQGTRFEPWMAKKFRQRLGSSSQ